MHICVSLNVNSMRSIIVLIKLLCMYWCSKASNFLRPSPKLPNGALSLHDSPRGLPYPDALTSRSLTWNTEYASELGAQFSTPAFSTPVIWCRVFNSRVFHPCYLVPRFPPLQFRWCRVFHSFVFSQPLSLSQTFINSSITSCTKFPRSYSIDVFLRTGQPKFPYSYGGGLYPCSSAFCWSFPFSNLFTKSKIFLLEHTMLATTCDEACFRQLTW